MILGDRELVMAGRYQVYAKPTLRVALIRAGVNGSACAHLALGLQAGVSYRSTPSKLWRGRTPRDGPPFGSSWGTDVATLQTRRGAAPNPFSALNLLSGVAVTSAE